MAEEIIKLWKEKNIDHVDFNFSCGGDSMNDTEIQIYDKQGNEVECSEISDHIDSEVYNKVEFYVNSDGHYMGESGTVKVELVEDDEEPYLSYSKSSSIKSSNTSHKSGAFPVGVGKNPHSTASSDSNGILNIVSASANACTPNPTGLCFIFESFASLTG